MGRVDRPKGILKATEISNNIIPFIQDSDYYLQKGSYYHQKNKLSKALLFLKKAIEVEPGNAHHHYNLACLLSKTSHIEEANRIFMHIVTKLNPELTECYFLMAVNCGLMEDLPQAKKYLESYLQRTPEGDMAEEARELLAAMEEDEELAEHNSSFTVQDNQMLESFLSALTEESLQSYWEDYSFRHALLRGLHQGSDSLKEKIISVFGKIGTGEAESHLREYVISPWVKERLRQIAIRELKIFSTNRSCRIFDAGRIVDINLDQYSLPFPVWKEEWQKVLDCVLANMTNSPYYGEEFYDDVQAIWLDFINHLYPRIPPMSRAQAWAAGLEYCLARFHFLGLTQKELADKYGISPSSVSQKFRQINEVLHIEQKAYRNMLAFLANQDRGRD